jgi:spore coat protein U-like protein
MAIAAKRKGKRGGARVITYTMYVDAANSRIYLLTIYNKGEQASISKSTIQKLKTENGLQ